MLDPADPCRSLTHGIMQVELLLVLQRLTEHFAAATMSIEPTRPFDSVRIVVCGCICAIADSLLRRHATNNPSGKRHDPPILCVADRHCFERD